MTGAAQAPADTIALLADLHLAGGDHDPFSDDERFVETIGGLVAGASHSRLRVVLLGDTFDFPAVLLPGRRATPATRPAEAAAKLERIVAAHPLVVEALRDLVRAGHRLDVVAGNHDMELLMPAVHSRLLATLGGPPGSVQVHPWMLYVPGVLYAEHGQQHHDFNRFPWLGTEQPRAEDPLALPAGSYVDALAHLRQWHPEASAPAVAAQAARMGAGLVASLARLSRAERHRDERERRLGAEPPAGLSAAAVLGIDRASAATPTAIARRAAAMASRRLRSSGSGPATPFMQTAAHAVHRVLEAEGCAVPFYAFGHTHVPADVALADGAPARYLNPGTWSSLTRRVTGGDRRCGVVLVQPVPGADPRAELLIP
jgi:UDP-2,3-diacylglucosamine pyrophosphatase LpxH